MCQDLTGLFRLQIHESPHRKARRALSMWRIVLLVNGPIVIKLFGAELTLVLGTRWPGGPVTSVLSLLLDVDRVRCPTGQDLQL